MLPTRRRRGTRLNHERGRVVCLYNKQTYASTDKPRITQYKAERNLSYIFIAYTAEQFQSAEDLRVLHQIADEAARNAGVMAYWVGCSCMPDADQLQEDVSLFYSFAQNSLDY